MLECPYDNYTAFEWHERSQERKWYDWDDCEDDDDENWEDEEFEC
jgi:hypothetical protein